MTEFASKWPDPRLWAISILGPKFPGVKVSAERDEALVKQLVVSAVWQNNETAVSRFCLVTVEGWDAEGKDRAQDLTGDAAFELESAPRNSKPVVKTSLNAGPNEVRDPVTGIYNYEAIVLVTFHRLATS